MSLRQKAAVGFFLCPSLAMIAMTPILVSKIDTLYEISRQYMEASIAILVAFLTAFRTRFVLQREKKGYRKRTSDEENDLPEVPRATLTGLRTFIKGSNRTFNDDIEHLVVQKNTEASQISFKDNFENSFITKPIM
ncbi:hypothetical protein GQ44DRAFT_722277 [Phaeosphaeriaceae sp. PMI808]|nr:hypothetical protein GQ44DRAFT_722277 [Phaeosphaeriaceae sp. PMI808]